MTRHKTGEIVLLRFPFSDLASQKGNHQIATAPAAVPC